MLLVIIGYYDKCLLFRKERGIVEKYYMLLLIKVGLRVHFFCGQTVKANQTLQYENTGGKE